MHSNSSAQESRESGEGDSSRAGVHETSEADPPSLNVRMGCSGRTFYVPRSSPLPTPEQIPPPESGTGASPEASLEPETSGGQPKLEPGSRSPETSDSGSSEAEADKERGTGEEKSVLESDAKEITPSPETRDGAKADSGSKIIDPPQSPGSATSPSARSQKGNKRRTKRKPAPEIS